GRPLRWLAADVAGSADSAFPSPPRIGAVVRRAGVAVENTGVILTGQRNVVLAVSIDHRGEIVAVVALPARAHQLAVESEIVRPEFGVVGRVRAKPDLRTAAQMKIDVAQQCDRSRAIPVAGRDDDASAAGAMARRNGGGEGGVIVGRAGRGREAGRARGAGSVDERHLDELALHGAEAGDMELTQFTPAAFGCVAEPSEAIDDELRLPPRIAGVTAGVRCRIAGRPSTAPQ